LVWKVFGPSARVARHAAQATAREGLGRAVGIGDHIAGIGDHIAGIGDLGRICNAQICHGRAVRISISIWERPPDRC
jgi:hypothetical protein